MAVERLRAWERRYGLEPAHKAGKTRFYDRNQLNQLTKIKKLIDYGHPISSLINLSEAQLDSRLLDQQATQRDTQPAQPVVPIAATVGVIGANLVALEQQQGADSRLDVQARWSNCEAFFADEDETEGLSVLLVQLPVLQLSMIENISDLQKHSQIIVLYQYAVPHQLNAALQLGVTALQWPASWQQIEQATAQSAGTPLRAGRTATRRFSDSEIIAIAATSTDPSKCPQHLVELITQLNAFAEYAQVVSAEATAPELYERVARDTTLARAQLEMALEAMVEAEESATKSSKKSNLYKIYK